MTAENLKRVSWQLLALVIGCSLLIRVFALREVATTPLTSDSADYARMASYLLHGRQFVPYWPPGLSLYLTPFVAMGWGNTALRASMLVWWLVFCYALVRLARDLELSDEIVVILLGVFSIAPALIHFSIEPMTQMPSATLLLLAVGAAVRCWKRPDGREALLLGAALGGLSLVRASAIPLLIAFPALLFLRWKRLQDPLIAFALGGAMILIWVAKMHQLSGQWMINNSNGANLYYGNNPWTPIYRSWYFGSHAKLNTDEIKKFPEYETVMRNITHLPETQQEVAFEKRAVTYVLHRPDLFLLRTVNRVRCFWGFDIFTAANLRTGSAKARRWFPVVLGIDSLCYLAIAGFAFFWIAAAPGSLWARWETWLLGASVILYGLPYWVTMSHPTYHFPVMAPLALLGVLAWKLVRSSGLGNIKRGWIALTVLILIQVEWVFYLTQA